MAIRWTEAEDAAIRSHAAQHSLEDLTLIVGRSGPGRSVRQVGDRRSLLGFGVPANAGVWPDARAALARKYYIDECLSASVTAKLVGDCTRNAIVGLAHRRGWERRADVGEFNTRAAIKRTTRVNVVTHLRTKKVPDDRGDRRGRALGSVIALNIPHWISRRDAACGPEVSITGAAPSSLNLMISDAGYSTRSCCKWPTSGDGAQTTFCAVAIEPGRTYCADHHHVAFRVVAAKKKQAQSRDLARFMKRFG